MSIAIKSAVAGALAALMLAAVPHAKAHGGDRDWSYRDWDRGHRHERFDRGWRHRHHDRVVVIREPRTIYRDRLYYEEPIRYRPRRPSLVIGVDVPPLVVGF